MQLMQFLSLKLHGKITGQCNQNNLTQTKCITPVTYFVLEIVGHIEASTIVTKQMLVRPVSSLAHQKTLTYGCSYDPNPNIHSDELPILS